MTLIFGSLFTGIGGFDLGLERAGMECKWQVEIDPFCNKVLEKHWPKVRRYKDVREVHGINSHAKRNGCNETEEQRSIRQSNGESRVQEFKGLHGTSRSLPETCPSCLEPVDLICGGFPCQPFSVAGKRKGTEDNRYLWGEMFRVISDVKPTWVIAENVRGLLSIEGGMVFENCCLDLEIIGYEVQAFIIPACAVQAPHRRDRVWIVAYRKGTGTGSNKRRIRDFSIGESGGKKTDCHVADSYSQYSQEYQRGNQFRQERSKGTLGWGVYEPTWEKNWLEVAQRFCKLDDGLPDRLVRPARNRNRVQKLKALGNAVVPQIVEILGRAILKVDSCLKHY
jgi:DNA (cytosine-5)-methyltransferase 1